MLLLAALLAAASPATDARTPAVIHQVMREAGGIDRSARVSVAYADVGGDAREEAIVYLADPGHCGSGGCALVVLTPSGKGWRAIGKTSVTRLPADSPALGAVAAIKAKDAAFDVDKFMAGARNAFQTTVQAYAAGDRETLKPLLGPEAASAFEAGMAQREAEGRSESVEFLQPPRADLEDAAVEGDVARVKVRFLAEFRNRSKGPEGEAVDDRRTAEVWTFERLLTVKDSGWTLARVEAAEA